MTRFCGKASLPLTANGLRENFALFKLEQKVNLETSFVQTRAKRKTGNFAFFKLEQKLNLSFVQSRSKCKPRSYALLKLE